MTTGTPTPLGLVRIDGLIAALFEPSAAPSKDTVYRWVRNRQITHKKIGHSVFFDVEEARASLNKNSTVKARGF